MSRAHLLRPTARTAVAGLLGAAALSAGVALTATSGWLSVRASERKSALSMLIQHVLPILPVDRRMARLTVQTKLAAVNVGMAISTLHTDPVEAKVSMTAGALGRLVNAKQ